MLGLAQQIGRAHLGVGAVVGDDQDLGRPGEQIDADLAIELALGFGDIGVAGPDQHVDRLESLGAERHRRHRLDAAQHMDLVGAAQMHRRDRLGMRAALVRRGAGGDVADAGDLRGDDRHMRRGDHRVAPARHIAADPADRDMAMAEHHAGQGLDLDILQRGALDLGEVADLRLGEFDVGDGLRRDLRDESADLVVGQPKARRRPFVEFLGQFAHRRVAARADIGDDALDGAADLGVGLVLGPGQRRGFDVARHPILHACYRLLFAVNQQAGRALNDRPAARSSERYETILAILRTSVRKLNPSRRPLPGKRSTRYAPKPTFLLGSRLSDLPGPADLPTVGLNHGPQQNAAFRIARHGQSSRTQIATNSQS